MVSDLKRFVAETLTPCAVVAPADPLMVLPPPMKALVRTVSNVTDTPPATPTNPPPMAATRPKTSSLESALTMTPENVLRPRPVESTLPSETPPMALPCARASTTLLAPR